MKIAVLCGDADFREQILCITCEDPKILLRLDAGPENAWILRVREPADSAHCDANSPGLRDRGEHIFYFLKARLWPFSNEFGGDVEMIHRAPGELCGGTQTVNQGTKPRLDFVGYLDGGKQAHVECFGIS